MALSPAPVRICSGIGDARRSMKGPSAAIELLIDKILLLTARINIGGLFSRVKGYFPSKIRAGDAVGNGR
jgi:hypothetical protein